MTEIVPVPLSNSLERQGEDGLRNAIMRSDSSRAELAKAGEYPQLLKGLLYLKDIKADLDTLIRATEDDITRLMPEKKMFIDDVGTVERRMSSTRKWESEDLLKHITRSTLDPEGTGEVSINNVVLLIDTLKAVLPFTASLGWRVTALKELGINVSEYSQATYGRQTVQITK
jgi:hypothetical protein